MSSLEELRDERMKKRDALMSAGQVPYPSATARTHENVVITTDVAGFVERGERITLAGRIMALRRHGGSAFADVFDGTAKVQLFLSEVEVGEEQYQLFSDTIDLGDFIEATGVMFVTKRGTYALGVASWRVLTKALQAIPSEHFGIKDEDERFRKRYLDLLLNPEVRDIAYKRAKFWQAVRRFHEEHGFLEVHTPTLEVTTGGGDARPFATHHHALDIDVYLRISAGELWQKRLMVAGFPKTFEVGRIFRNEGMSAEHLQEYEQCEAYSAYWNFEQMYTFLRECYQYVAQETFGTTKFTIRGFEVDLAGEWPLIDYATEIEAQTGIDIWTAAEDKMKARLIELGVVYSGADNRERLVDTLWKYCRKNIGGPAILINEPTALSPLAKKQADERVVERFHFIIAGSEVGQGYSELNDPADQRERFLAQQALRDAGDDEAQMADMEFVEALEYGMPPTAGHGFSERLFAFFLDRPIREVQLFPLMKPKQNDTDSSITIDADT
jgi:lysyl-tRNA synthetase class 2